MMLGIDTQIILTIGAVALAALLVVLEQWKGPRPFRSWKLWLALLFLIISIVASLVESDTASRIEKERKADMKLIQKLNTGLNALCFEINLKQYDTMYQEGCSFQLSTCLPVADLNTTGLYGEYIHFNFHPDSGWYRDKRFVLKWPSIIFRFDSTRNTVRFDMSPFGVRWKDQLAWKAEQLTDISQVRFGLLMMYGVDTETGFPADTEWSPVEYISIFANDYDAENLITTLTPRLPSSATDGRVIYFHPENQSVRDQDWFQFNIDLLQMRSNLIHLTDY
jgi:hypothetical protein